MPARRAEAEWRGDLTAGSGTVSLGSGAFSGSYSFKSRFEDDGGSAGTNPEELIGAAHASCFSMALSNTLASDGHVPERVHTTATVHLTKDEEGFAIRRIELVTDASVPGVDEATFQQAAEKAKATCPVSRALAATEIELTATLSS